MERAMGFKKWTKSLISKEKLADPREYETVLYRDEDGEQSVEQRETTATESGEPGRS